MGDGLARRSEAGKCEEGSEKRIKVLKMIVAGSAEEDNRPGNWSEIERKE